MNRRPRPIIAVAAVTAALLALTGCGVLTSADDSTGSGPISTVPASPTPTGTAGDQPTADSGLGDAVKDVKDSGDIPDVCTLLTKAQVTALTGRAITQTDPDGGQPGDITRYCQWQLEGGQLAVFLSRTSEEDFKVRTAEAVPVSGIGHDAFQLAGHLYVIYGTVMVDVYARGGSDAENLTVAKKTVDLLLPQV
jgi:hypothetical protein